MEKEKQNGEIIQKTDCNMCDGAFLGALWGTGFPLFYVGFFDVKKKHDRKPDFVCRIPIFRSRNTYVFDGMYY